MMHVFVLYLQQIYRLNMMKGGWMSEVGATMNVSILNTLASTCMCHIADVETCLKPKYRMLKDERSSPHGFCRRSSMCVALSKNSNRAERSRNDQARLRLLMARRLTVLITETTATIHGLAEIFQHSSAESLLPFHPQRQQQQRNQQQQQPVPRPVTAPTSA